MEWEILKLPNLILSRPVNITYPQFSGIIVLIVSTLIALGGPRASLQLHLSLLDGILRCSMYFFESTPTGRLVNLFSKDIDIIDRNIPRAFDFVLECTLECTFIIMAVSYTSPYSLTVMPGLLILYFFIQVIPNLSIL